MRAWPIDASILIEHGDTSSDADAEADEKQDPDNSDPYRHAQRITRTW